MPRPRPPALLLLAALAATPAIAADPGGADLGAVAESAADRIAAIYPDSGMVGLRSAIDDCLDRAETRPAAARTCLALTWGAIHLDASVSGSLGYPPVLDGDALAERALAAWRRAGGSDEQALRLRTLAREAVEAR